MSEVINAVFLKRVFKEQAFKDIYSNTRDPAIKELNCGG